MPVFRDRERAGADSEKSFRKIVGYWDLCMLKAVLDTGETTREKPASTVDKQGLGA